MWKGSDPPPASPPVWIFTLISFLFDPFPNVMQTAVDVECSYHHSRLSSSVTVVIKDYDVISSKHWSNYLKVEILHEDDKKFCKVKSLLTGLSGWKKASIPELSSDKHVMSSWYLDDNPTRFVMISRFWISDFCHKTCSHHSSPYLPAFKLSLLHLKNWCHQHLWHLSWIKVWLGKNEQYSWIYFNSL